MAATAIASKVGVVSNLTKGALGTSKLLAVASMNKVGFILPNSFQTLFDFRFNQQVFTAKPRGTWSRA